MGRLSWIIYLGGPSLIMRVLKSRELFLAVFRERYDDKKKKGQRDTRLLALETEQWGHKPRNAVKRRKKILP